jgi:integrase
VGKSNLRTNTAQWKESKGYWQINVQKDGERKSFYSSKVGRTGQRECNAKADKWLDSGVSDSKKTVSALFSEYWGSVSVTLSSGEARNIESCFRVRVLPAIGYKKIADVTDGDIQHLINNMVADNLSKKTITNYKNKLSAFFKWCKLNKYSDYEMTAVEVPKSVRYKGKTVLQPNELKTLFEVDTTIFKGKRVFEPCVYSFRFLCASGLRVGEMYGLRWSDIQHGYINVTRSINIQGEETQGKNENALRSVPITRQLEDILQAQKDLKLDTEAVFDLPKYRGYYKKWQRYCVSNGIQAISLYELRHTYVSIVKNLSVGEVKELVGHSADMDTFGVYGHALNGEAERTASNVSDIFDTLLEVDTKQETCSERLQAIRTKLVNASVSDDVTNDIMNDIQELLKMAKVTH